MWDRLRERVRSQSVWADSKLLWFGKLVNNRNVSVLEAVKSKIKALADWVCGGQLSAVSPHGGRDKGALWGLFFKGTDPINEGSRPTLLKAPLPNTVTISGGTDIQSAAGIFIQRTQASVNNEKKDLSDPFGRDRGTLPGVEAGAC